MRRPRYIAILVGGALALGACAQDGAVPGRDRRDAERDGLYRDFFGGKYDELGHPVGARVWQAETDCEPETGRPAAEGWSVGPGDAPGVLCDVDSGAIGRGRFTVNVRALAPDTSAEEEIALIVRVVDADGEELAALEVPHDHFTEELVYQNVPLTFTHRADGGVRVLVEWAGRAVRFDYVELFRARRGLSLTPASGILSGKDALQVEVLDPSDGWQLELTCTDERGEAEHDLSGRLSELVAAGEAVRAEAEFRTRITAPASLLEACPRPTRVTARVVTGSWTREAARVTYRAALPACDFDGDPEAVRVLITGFEPFPADAWHPNSSEQAVLGYDAGAHPAARVMRLVLPVEWQTAAERVARVIERCDPDVIVGFGQGRSRVDVETTAYNVMDSSDVAGGVPDNRGLVQGGVPIEPGAPAELSTGLPVADVLARLEAAGVDASDSDDPGRYICNNLFYAIMRAVRSSDAVGGFVHLPYMARIGADERAELQAVVDAVVAGALGHVD